MKKRMLVLWLLLLPGALTVSADSNSVDFWKYEKEIVIGAESEYKSLMLDKEVYRYSKDDLSDLRIVNAQNEFVPYYLESYYEEIIQEDTQFTYPSEEILMFKKENDTFFDFKLQMDNQQKDFIVDQLEFQFDLSSNFAKDIKIYGSYDNEEWELIQQDSIFNIVNEKKSKTSVYFDSDKKYSFYRISILQNAEDIQLQSLVGVKSAEMITNQSDFIIEEVPTYEVSEEARQTTISIANPNKLKIDQIQLITDDRFDRAYELYVKEDSLYSVGSINSELGGNIVHLHDTYNRNALEEIKLIIDNKDDQPISIEEIRITYSIDKIVFKAAKNQDYRMFIGNEEANAPSYDISSYKQTIENKGKEMVVFGETFEKENEEMDPEKYNTQWILNIVVILTSIFLIFIILRKTEK